MVKLEIGSPGVYITGQMTSTLEQHVLAINERHHLFAPGEHLLLGLSGGHDSVVLLHLLCAFRRRGLIRAVSACHVNHGLRATAARRDEQFCRELCRRLRVSLTIIRKDVRAYAAEHHRSIEEAGRLVRYAALEATAAQRGADRIVLAHHLNDQVETILFRLARGTGPDGAVGMPIRRGNIIRPLLETELSLLVRYQQQHRLRYCHDRSNDEVDFARNRIRLRVIPELEQINRSAVSNIGAFAQLLAEELAPNIRTAAQQMLSRLSISPGGKISLVLSGWEEYHKALQRRMLRELVRSRWGVILDRAETERLAQLCMAGHGQITCAGGLTAACQQGSVLIRHSSVPPFHVQLYASTTQLPGLQALIRKRTMQSAAGFRIDPENKRVGLDADLIVGGLVARSVRPGDRFWPMGSPGEKKVGDLMTDRKVARLLRDEQVVVCDESGIVWAVGLAIAERVKRTGRTTRVLQLAYHQTGQEASAV